MPHCPNNVLHMVDPTLLHKPVKNNKLNIHLQCYNHIPANNKYPLKCHRFATYANSFMVHTWDYYVSIYTSYELDAINNMTRSTNIYTFQITSICPWTYMHATLHKYVPLKFCHSLHIDPILLHISFIKSIHCNIYSPNYCKICVTHNMALKCTKYGICLN